MNNNPTKKVGLKMQEFPGSWFNDNFSQVYTTHPLQAIPVRCIDVPGPAFIDLEFGSKIETLPALSPLYDSWTFTTKFVFCPYRLYISKLRINNVEDVGAFDDEYFPRLVYYGKTAPFWRDALNPSVSTNDEYGDLGYGRTLPGGDLNRVTYGSFPAVLRGSLMERLGYQPGELLTGQTFVSESYNVSTSLADRNGQARADVVYDWRTDFNIVPVLAYIDTWLYFEFNKQDKSIPVYKEDFYFGPGIKSRLSYIEYDDLKSLIPSFAFGKLRNTSTHPDLGANVMHIGDAENGERMYLRAERGGKNELCEGYPLFSNFHSVADAVALSEDGYYKFSVNDDINLNLGPWSPTMFNTPWSYSEGVDLDTSLQQYGTLWTYMRNSMSRVGLLPTTLNGDKFTSWFDSESIEKLRTYVIKNNMTFEQMRIKHSDYYMQVLSMISGNRYTDYLQFVFDSALELKDHPIFVGSDTIRFNFMDVLNQAQGSSGEYNESLGSTGSKGYVGFNKGRPIKFKTREPGMLLCYSVLTPIVRYFQGENLFFAKTQFSEVWHPQYRGRGFTNVRRSEIYKGSMGNVSTGSQYIHGASLDDDALGFVPVGWEYMNEENRASAGMALDYFKPWTLMRDFNDYLGTERYRPAFDDEFFNPGWNIEFNEYPIARQLRSTYGTDDSFNYNFANVGQDAENFIVKTEFNYSRFVPIGKQLIKPNL